MLGVEVRTLGSMKVKVGTRVQPPFQGSIYRKFRLAQLIYLVKAVAREMVSKGTLSWKSIKDQSGGQ